jgi:hypothetical protein
MKTNLNELPNSLDILEMLEVKGGVDTEDPTCISSAITVECKKENSGYIASDENDD